MRLPGAFTDYPTAARPFSPVRLFVATALLILVLLAATCGMLFVSLQDTLRQEKTNLRNLAIAFSAQTFSVVEAIGNVMLESERAAAMRSPALPLSDAFDNFSKNSMAREYVLGIHLYDSTGRLVASAVTQNGKGAARATVRPPPSDIGAAPDAEPGSLRITISNVDPATGHGVISFSRASVDASGKRNGTIVAEADSERFERIYSLVELGKGGSVTLFNRSGTMLVRGPNFPSGIGQSFAATPLFRQYLPVSGRGAFTTASPLDGKERLYGYDAVTSYPLVLVTAKDQSDALAAWYGRLWTAMTSFALISMTVIFLVWRVARDARRQFSLIGKLAASEERAEKSANYLAAILNAVSTPIWVLDSARKIVMLNDAFCRFVGRGAAELVGQRESDVLETASAGERELRNLRYQSVLDGGPDAGAVAGITEILDGAGAPRTVILLSSRLEGEAGQPQVVSVLTDITERQKAERRLAYIANFDLLTGLPNHGRFRRMLEAEVASAAARDTWVGTLVVSLQRVQEITDLLGHAAGDSALRQIGEVFQSLLPRAQGVARIKSHEFAVVIEASGGREFFAQYAIELLHRLSGALKVGDREFYLGPAIGVSIFPEDGASADELFGRADSARNRAASDTGNRIHFFSARAQIDLDERLTVEAQLRRALERDEFRLVFQPKVQIASGRINGFETLLRWTSPVLGDVAPERFIPIAERTGLIIEIGAWVFQAACRHLHRWQQAGADIKLAVNLSPRQFYQSDLVPMISQCVERCAIAPGSLELEITESALMSREQEVDVLMREIRALGIELSIDDFGTGYSSLAYLKRFPVQRLKIDRAFIRDLGHDDDSAAIVRSILNLANGLKLNVVAEGVETETQLAILRSMTCDEYQGYLFSRPVEADAVLSLFEVNRAASA
jgi:diguanylate cyclase (GGDEF)-like protein/PAS domain S-box-containing protein